MCLVSQVLALAARELSKPITQKTAPPPAVSANTDLTPRDGGDDQPVDWRQEVQRRIQSKTRRLTKVVTATRNMGLFIFALRSFNQPTVNFSHVAGCHQSFTRGHAEPLRQPGWSLLLSFAQELR